MLWGLHATSCEIARWRRYALLIPDEPIRADALQVLERKRTHLHGAALFWTLPRKRNCQLLRLLVAYELIWDFLDNLSERAAAHGHTDGRQLHMAIAEAIDPMARLSDYYAQHPWHDDGGYLRSLVRCCQQTCGSLPSYRRVRDIALREARRAQVLALNHHPVPDLRDALLKRWVATEYPEERSESWWELSGAASAPLAIHALLALAAEPICSQVEITDTYAAYSPLSAATTMLDSYVDQQQDQETGDHSYIAHYPDETSAVQGVRVLVRRSLSEALKLRDGHRHAVIAAAMIAMYLSKQIAPTPQHQAGTNTLTHAGGSLTQLLLPILRAWRLAYSQRTA
ncbi:MAG: DUF2600 family protein [Solirubrobacteraceae bacterium]